MDTVFFGTPGRFLYQQCSAVVDVTSFLYLSRRTSGYGYLPRELVALNSLEEEP